MRRAIRLSVSKFPAVPTHRKFAFALFSGLLSSAIALLTKGVFVLAFGLLSPCHCPWHRFPWGHCEQDGVELGPNASCTRGTRRESS